MNELRLASSSAVRLAMLQAAGLNVVVSPARVNEPAVRDAMTAEGARPREIADALADLKARKVGLAHRNGLTLWADQVLDLDGQVLGKPASQDAARNLLLRLSGRTHVLHAAAVVYADGRPVWRHIGQARMTMRVLSPDYIDGYVSRNWDSIRHSAGGYLVESEGIRLFAAIGADYHSILGLPLVPLLNWLTSSGEIAG